MVTFQGESGLIIRPKPKLPRKRKKAMIKMNGRSMYKNTVRAFWSFGFEDEKVCKFWKKVDYSQHIPTPTEFF